MSTFASLREEQSPVAEKPDRCDILGVGVHAVAMDSALRIVEQAIQARRKGYVCFTGVHGIMESQKDPELRHILNSSMLNAPDGMPTVWVGRWHGHASMRRVYGPDFMVDLCRLSAKKGYTHFLYGGVPGVAEELRNSLTVRFPALQIVGTCTPPFRPLNSGERAELKAQVAACKPDVFWVGLSTPKQEHFMAEFLNQLDVTVMCGVGAAFDIHSGRRKDAPAWIKRIGMQWFHRMLQEPRRLGKRYLINNPRFVVRILAQALGVPRASI